MIERKLIRPNVEITFEHNNTGYWLHIKNLENGKISVIDLTEVQYKEVKEIFDR